VTYIRLGFGAALIKHIFADILISADLNMNILWKKYLVLGHSSSKILRRSISFNIFIQ